MTTLIPLSQIPEGSFFKVAEPYDVGGSHLEGNGIFLTMLTDQVYQVEGVYEEIIMTRTCGFSEVSGAFLAKSKGCPDELMDVNTAGVDHILKRNVLLVIPVSPDDPSYPTGYEPFDDTYTGQTNVTQS